MADKTTGELSSVKVEDLPAAPDIYDDFKMPGELQGSSVYVTGAQMKQYAQQSVSPIAETAATYAAQAARQAAAAKSSADTAEGAKTAAQSALSGVQAALNNLPAGDTLIINDLTTGGTSAALSAEMGKVLAQRPNPQLLHNAYFKNAVNQRKNTTYTAIGYTVDRWRILTANTSLPVGKEGITLAHSGAGGDLGVIRQTLEHPAVLYGKIVTVSILLSDGSFAYRTGKIPETPPGQDTVVALATLDTSGAAGRYFALFESTDGELRAQMKVPSGGEMTVAAVKLELGSVQTLAHQDSSGKWVLNEIPDYGEELAKCQRYYQLFSGADKRPTALADYRPAMRDTPATGTITIDGVVYYYADANL